MLPGTPSCISVYQPSGLSSGYLEAHWYAAYTCPNREKRVAAQLNRREIECFLPLYETVHRWKDRRMHLQLPLFPGYIFVRLELRDRLKVLQIPGVVRLVGKSQRMPEPLPEQEIEALRSGLSAGVRAHPHRYIAVGRRVRIKNGPLAGLEGILQRRKGKCRVVLSVELIARSIVVEADVADVASASTPVLKVRSGADRQRGQSQPTWF